jgi:hypothetical protein
MFKKDDKRRLYWLMDIYLSNEITAKTFCDEFYYCYDLELDSELLTKLEEQVFSELGTVTGRFSEFEEDIRQYPGTYFTEKQLKQKVLEALEKLKEERPI